MDMKNMERYGKLEFMDAAEELGMFQKQDTVIDMGENKKKEIFFGLLYI